MLRKGDRVRVVLISRRLRAAIIYWGRIVGECRDRKAWIVKRDDIKTPTAYHKSFCRPEIPDAQQG